MYVYVCVCVCACVCVCMCAGGQQWRDQPEEDRQSSCSVRQENEGGSTKVGVCVKEFCLNRDCLEVSHYM